MDTDVLEHPFRREGRARRTVPFAVAALFGLATLALPPAPSSEAGVVGAIAITIAIVVGVVVAPWSRLPRWTEALPPLLYLVVVALLRQAFGAEAGWGPLAMLPIFWLALYGTREQLAVGIAGLSAVFLMPLIAIGGSAAPPGEVRRAMLWTAVAMLVGFAVQRLVARTRANEAIAAERARRLAASEARFSAAIECAPVGIAEVALDGRITSANPAFGALVGRAPWVLLGRPLADLVDPGEREAERANLAALADAGAGTWQGERHYARPDGTAVPALINLTVVPDPDGRAIGLLVQAQDITDRKRAERALRLHATTDALTGLPNRREWDVRLQAAVDAASPERPLCLALVDLDHFKPFNDSRGHQDGDRLLKAAAAAWRGQLRDGDLLARYGGDEFALLLLGCGPAEAGAVIERLRGVVPEGRTASAGIACRLDGESAAALFARADRALYEAKAAGRDRVRLAGDEAPAPDAVRHARPPTA